MRFCYMGKGAIDMTQTKGFYCRLLSFAKIVGVWFAFILVYLLSKIKTVPLLKKSNFFHLVSN